MEGGRLDRLWYGQDLSAGENLLSAMLSPLAWAYRAGAAIATRRVSPVRIGRPVVSVGNLTAGGSGKTPLVVELVRLLEAGGLSVAIVSRGYRRQSRGPRVVHGPGGGFPLAQEAGDEPALLSRRCPQASVVVGEDRVEACLLAVKEFSPQIIVCDDAFQHRRLHREVDILAVHARRGFGNRWLLPRGPLREPLSAAARATLAVFTYANVEPAEELSRRFGLPPGIPAAACSFVPAGFSRGNTGERLDRLPQSGPVLAACAIAFADGFRSSCREAGLEVAELVAFPDHHRFTAADLTRLEHVAARHNVAGVVVTEKDQVRLEAAEISVPIFALRLEARWCRSADEEAVKAMLQNAVDRAGAV